eukprot:m.147057 g.147057  ORF g.147057 m.147057 type:complete len:110 (+) comp52722_c0_seq5:742-1071(+)
MKPQSRFCLPQACAPSLPAPTFRGSVQLWSTETFDSLWVVDLGFMPHGLFVGAECVGVCWGKPLETVDYVSMLAIDSGRLVCNLNPYPGRIFTTFLQERPWYAHIKGAT